MTRTSEDGFDPCAGCGRLCLQKRVVIREPVEVKGLCVAPWCATVITRSRVCETIEGGDGTLKVREFANVCSLKCFVAMSADFAWELVKPRRGKVDKTALFIGEDKLVLKYGATGLIPIEPQVGWLLVPGRTPLPGGEGPYR